jgi:hypothetical protein
VRATKKRLRRRSPAATGTGLRRIFCWRSSAELTRLVVSVDAVCDWLGKRVAVMVPGEWEIVMMQVGEGEEEEEVQIPWLCVSRVGVLGWG